MTPSKAQKATFVGDGDDGPKVSSNNFSNEIPVISLAGIDEELNGSGGEIKKKIVEACEVWGIFQVVDHGVDANLMSDMTRLAREFFDLPPEEKLRFDMSCGKKGGFLITTKLKGEAKQDWREIVTFFTYPTRNRNYSLWPGKPEGWIAVTEEYGEKVMGLGCKLLEVLSEAMGLEKEAVGKACMDMNQKILANFYPKCPDSDLALGLQRHTDSGTITILLQDQVGGLQATRDGGNSWITVQPLEGAFVVNVGDHGHYVSNGRFKNGEHRVVASSESNRLSIAAFQSPAPEAIVYPLKVGEEEEPVVVLEEPITYLDMYTRKMNNEPLLAIFNKVVDDEHKHTT